MLDGANQNIYLHETVDLVPSPDSPMRWMDHILDFDIERAGGGTTLLGVWAVGGMSGRRQSCIEIWETKGWDGFRQVKKRGVNPDLTNTWAVKDWWKSSWDYRNSIFDRACFAGPGCPTKEQLLEASVKGEIFVHELSTCKAGSGNDYLASVLEKHAPVMAEHGHRLVGSYLPMMTDTEVITLWATDLESAVEIFESADERISQFRRASTEYLTSYNQQWLMPHPRSPLAASPPSTEEP